MGAQSFRAKRRLVVVAVLSILGSVAACANVLGLGDVGYGGDAGREGDAAVDAPIDGTATFDGAGDAGGDAPSEGNGHGDSAPPPAVGCQAFPDASFCVDFEGSDPLGTQVWSKSNAPDGSLELTNDGGFSPTHAARFTGRGDAGCANITLTRTFNGPFSTYSLRAAARFEVVSDPLVIQLGAAGGPLYVLIAGLDSPLTWSVRLQKFTADGGADLTPKLSVALDLTPIGGPWTEVTLRVESNPNPHAVATIGATSITLPLPGEVPFLNPAAFVGSWCSKPSTAVTLDDVVVYDTP